MDLFLDFLTIFRKLMVILALGEKVRWSKGAPRVRRGSAGASPCLCSLLVPGQEEGEEVERLARASGAKFCPARSFL